MARGIAEANWRYAASSRTRIASCSSGSASRTETAAPSSAEASWAALAFRFALNDVIAQLPGGDDRSSPAPRPLQKGAARHSARSPGSRRSYGEADAIEHQLLPTVKPCRQAVKRRIRIEHSGSPLVRKVAARGRRGAAAVSMRLPEPASERTSGLLKLRAGPEAVVEAKPDRRVDLVPVEVAGLDPCDLGGLHGALELAADRSGPQADVDRLADLLDLVALQVGDQVIR